MKSIAVFNHTGGVGKTSLVYHLAWMYNQLGYNVLVADLDAQAKLSAMLLSDDDVLESLWDRSNTIFGALRPLLTSVGEVAMPPTATLAPGISLVVGDTLLAGTEDEFSSQWRNCMEGKERAFHVMSAIWRALLLAAEHTEAHFALMDVGSNLGALNRAALVAADHVVVPVAPDIYSLWALREIGPTLCKWREAWSDRLERNPVKGLPMPGGAMRPAGYVVLQHALRLDRPVQAYRHWLEQIPNAYSHHVLKRQAASAALPTSEDEHCLATLPPFRSLLPLAEESHKPMFALKPADGVVGARARAIAVCQRGFRDLAREIARRCDLPAPSHLKDDAPERNH